VALLLFNRGAVKAVAAALAEVPVEEDLELELALTLDSISWMMDCQLVAELGVPAVLVRPELVLELPSSAENRLVLPVLVLEPPMTPLTKLNWLF
jgi:hypothetical protein